MLAAMRGPILVVALTVGCGSSVPDRSADRQAFLLALSGTDQNAEQTCNSIKDASLVSDCIAAVAAQAAAGGGLERANSLCATLTGFWRDECWFVVANEFEGAAAVAVCAEADVFRSQCEQAAVERAMTDMRGFPRRIGAEAELMEAIEERVKELLAYREVEDTEMNAIVQRTTSKAIRERWRIKPMDPELCGDAPDEYCSQAMRETVRQDAEAIGRYLGTICRGRIVSARIDAKGGTPWTPAADLEIQAAWQGVCSTQGMRNGRTAGGMGGGMMGGGMMGGGMMGGGMAGQGQMQPGGMGGQGQPGGMGGQGQMQPGGIEGQGQPGGMGAPMQPGGTGAPGQMPGAGGGQPSNASTVPPG